MRNLLRLCIIRILGNRFVYVGQFILQHPLLNFAVDLIPNLTERSQFLVVRTFKRMCWTDCTSVRKTARFWLPRHLFPRLTVYSVEFMTRVGFHPERSSHVFL